MARQTGLADSSFFLLGHRRRTSEQVVRFAETFLISEAVTSSDIQFFSLQPIGGESTVGCKCLAKRERGHSTSR